MATMTPALAQSRLLLSGNEAVARAVWESGVQVAAAYPGTPATEILEALSSYPSEDIYTELLELNRKAFAAGRAAAAQTHFITTATA